HRRLTLERALHPEVTFEHETADEYVAGAERDGSLTALPEARLRRRLLCVRDGVHRGFPSMLLSAHPCRDNVSESRVIAPAGIYHPNSGGPPSFGCGAIRCTPAGGAERALLRRLRARLLRLLPRPARDGRSAPGG